MIGAVAISTEPILSVLDGKLFRLPHVGSMLVSALVSILEESVLLCHCFATRESIAGSYGSMKLIEPMQT
jgi:hypothetical protein